jgi:alpha-L-fucosidase 2
MAAKLDPGVHVGSWGQIQEWKIDMDEKNNTHRHLSNLYGWYPGYSISAVHGDNETITNAVATTLYSRGPGIEDANAGWEKVWRSACWALLGVTDEAYYELKLAIQENFVANGLSMYSGHEAPFQIDANFGITGAVLSMLIRDLDRPSEADNSGEGVQDVLLGPAIPASWGNGKVEGVRLRGGGSVSFGWDEAGIVNSCEADLENRADSVPQLNFIVSGGESIEC